MIVIHSYERNFKYELSKSITGLCIHRGIKFSIDKKETKIPKWVMGSKDILKVVTLFKTTV